MGFRENLMMLQEKQQIISKQLEVLTDLYKSGKISRVIYESFEKELSFSLLEVTSRSEQIKESMDQWTRRMESQLSLLERILADIEIAHFLGNIDEKNYLLKTSLILSGMQSTKNEIELLSSPSRLISERVLEPISDRVSPLEKGREGVEKEKGEKAPVKKRRDLKRREKPSVRRKKKRGKKLKAKTKEIDDSLLMIDPDLRCRNPWNKKCESRDIEVFIYYNEKSIPLCKECWSTIAERNLNW